MPGTTKGIRKPAAANLEAEDVKAYLIANPDFLSHHPDILERLTPPASARADGVVDFQAFMAERLRAEVDRLRLQQREMVASARANQSTLNRVHAAILFLLDAENFEQLIQAVTTDLAVLLDLDVACLLVESQEDREPTVLLSGVQIVPAGFVRDYLHGKDLVLESGVAGDPTIFGAGAGLVQSQALIRLTVSSEAPPCLMAMGSRDPEMFHAGMRTELIDFQARVLERCIRGWLNLPV
ncbi:MAG: DUF484 family protein [Inquilinaceae bacterium]